MYMNKIKSTLKKWFITEGESKQNEFEKFLDKVINWKTMYRIQIALAVFNVINVWWGVLAMVSLLIQHEIDEDKKTIDK